MLFDVGERFAPTQASTRVPAYFNKQFVPFDVLIDEFLGYWHD